MTEVFRPERALPAIALMVALTGAELACSEKAPVGMLVPPTVTRETGGGGSSGTQNAGSAGEMVDDGMRADSTDPDPDDASGGEVPPDDGLVSFDEDVHPILVESCGLVGCHDMPSFLPGHGAADVDVAFEEVQGESMGAPVYERILARTSGQDPAGFMPPPYAGCEEALGAPGCLTVEEFELIQTWVDQGAMNR